MAQANGTDATKKRLEGQIGWYDEKSAYCQKMFKGLKLLTIGAAALIPLFAGLSAPSWATGALGALIVVFEGAQQLNQYHANWIAYRDHGARGDGRGRPRAGVDYRPSDASDAGALLAHPDRREAAGA